MIYIVQLVIREFKIAFLHECGQCFHLDLLFLDTIQFLCIWINLGCKHRVGHPFCYSSCSLNKILLLLWWILFSFRVRYGCKTSVKRSKVNPPGISVKWGSCYHVSEYEDVSGSPCLWLLPRHCACEPLSVQSILPIPMVRHETVSQERGQPRNCCL